MTYEKTSRNKKARMNLENCRYFTWWQSDATLDSTTKTAVGRMPTVKMMGTVSSFSVDHSSVAVFYEPSRA